MIKNNKVRLVNTFSTNFGANHIATKYLPSDYLPQPFLSLFFKAKAKVIYDAHTNILGIIRDYLIWEYSRTCCLQLNAHDTAVVHSAVNNAHELIVVHFISCVAVTRRRNYFLEN